MVLRAVDALVDVVAVLREGALLRADTVAPAVHHQLARHLVREATVRELFHDAQHEVHTGGDAGARVDAFVLDVEDVLLHHGARRELAQLLGELEVRGAGNAIEQPGVRQHQGPRADTHQVRTVRMGIAQPLEKLLVGLERG